MMMMMMMMTMMMMTTTTMMMMMMMTMLPDEAIFPRQRAPPHVNQQDQGQQAEQVSRPSDEEPDGITLVGLPDDRLTRVRRHEIPEDVIAAETESQG
jgi:hypothetical protein